jgi:hypothetical protein
MVDQDRIDHASFRFRFRFRFQSRLLKLCRGFIYGFLLLYCVVTAKAWMGIHSRYYE